ncbi:hypothetical protein ACP70R_044242 [Stipagrostis hirtigluma subsp. patula]
MGLCCSSPASLPASPTIKTSTASGRGPPDIRSAAASGEEPPATPADEPLAASPNGDSSDAQKVTIIARGRPVHRTPNP